MVTHFVRNDVRLREIAGRLELALEGVIKPQVDVDLAVRRAIEGPHSGVAHPAPGGVAVPVDHEFGHRVRQPDAVELLLPDILRVGQHDGDEFEQPFFFRRALVADLPDLSAAEDGRRIEQAHLPADDAESGHYEEALEPECPAHDIEHGGEPGRTRRYPLAAGVGHVGAPSSSPPLHPTPFTTCKGLRQRQPRQS